MTDNTSKGSETLRQLVDEHSHNELRQQISSRTLKILLALIASIDDFWLKLKMLVIIGEHDTIVRMLNQRFTVADLSIVSNQDEIGIPIKLEMLVDFVKAFNIKENVIPGATKAKEEQVKDSIFFLVHPKHYKSAVCCYEGMQALTDGIENALHANRMGKIVQKSAGILMKFNSAKEIKKGFDYATKKNYQHFMADLIKQTGDLASSKFKADYQEKEGLKGWELAGWELIHAIDIDIQKFPELQDTVQLDLIDRLNEAGVEFEEIENLIDRCNFPEDTPLKKKYRLIRQLSEGSKYRD